MYDLNIREEELKLKVAKDFFSDFDTTEIIENIDFCVIQNENLFNNNALLWAEAKKGNKEDIYKSLVQLILTIGKAKIHEKRLPPEFLGAFDAQKIAFCPFNEIAEVFSQNDFNWNTTPSNHESKEFKQLYEQSKEILTSKSLIFDFFTTNEQNTPTKNKDLEYFIKNDFVVGWGKGKCIGITKNNFIAIYQKWLNKVKPSIKLEYKDENDKFLEFNPADFYLADLLSKDNKSLKTNLEVILANDHYEKTLPNGLEISIKFKDEQKAHKDFWHLYERPPIKEVRKHILSRRDLLVPQDIRERKGAFFTPQIWVEKAQEYLAKALGEDYQDEYYIWDCCAGTGNLLANLQNKTHIFASTLDEGDIKIMKDDALNGTNSLFENHIFQFDFLNDNFFDETDPKGKLIKKSKLPKKLQEIILKEPQKLIIFINPPYAEASNRKTTTNTGENKSQVATNTQIYEKYSNTYSTATRELFAQFFIRIHNEIPNCILASFSTLKYINSQYFQKFRENFKAKFLKGFAVPADTFDNVKGEFPIGFLIWDLAKKENLKQILVDIFEQGGTFLGQKGFYAISKNSFIIDWLQKFHDKKGDKLTYLRMQGTDFSNNRGCFLANDLSKNDFVKHLFTIVTPQNLIPFCIYFSVRHAIEATWLNDRDQFLYPNDKWQKDTEFQNDCLAFTLFHGQNRISTEVSRGGGVDTFVNHFIPFTEKEVGAKEAFKSDFMVKFISGKIKTPKEKQTQKQGFANADFYVNTQSFIPTKPLEFSKEAKVVFEAGREIWRYYHTSDFKSPQKTYNANASLYDIKAHFQGRNEKGRMNPRSDDAHYNSLMANLRNALKELAEKITSKLYDYGFLLE